MSKIYAHRGGAGYFAENTLKAFEFTIEQIFDYKCLEYILQGGFQ